VFQVSILAAIHAYLRDYTPPAPCAWKATAKKKLPEASPKPPKDAESCTLDYNGNGNPGWSDDDPVAGEKPISNPSLDQSTFHNDELPYRARSLWSRHLRDKLHDLAIDLTEHNELWNKPGP
jgi:hypothetical protein